MGHSAVTLTKPFVLNVHAESLRTSNESADEISANIKDKEMDKVLNGLDDDDRDKVEASKDGERILHKIDDTSLNGEGLRLRARRHMEAVGGYLRKSSEGLHESMTSFIMMISFVIAAIVVVLVLVLYFAKQRGSKKE